MAKLPKPEGNFRLHDGDQSSPIVGRWAWDAEPGTVWAKLKGARDSVADLAAGVRANRQTLQASGKYTDAGIDEQLLSVVPDMAKALRRAERVAANARNEVAKRRAGLTLKQPDPTNLAAVMDRQETRAWLRGMTQEQRDDYFRDNGDNLDPSIVEAVITAPREKSGIAQTRYDMLKSRAIEAQNPGVSENLKEMEEAIATLEKTIAANREGLPREIGNKFRPQIEQIAASVLQEVDAEFDRSESAERAAARRQAATRFSKGLALFRTKRKGR